MRHVIYGAGGVGGAIGARLFQRGREVVLIARGAHLEAVRRDGMTLETPLNSRCDGGRAVLLLSASAPRPVRICPPS